MQGRNTNKHWCKYDNDEKHKTLTQFQKLAKNQFYQRQTDADIYYNESEEGHTEDKDEDEVTASGQDEEVSIDDMVDLPIKSHF